MTWWQFHLTCDASDLDAAETVMLESGAISISLADAGDEPIYEPLPGTAPVWQASILTATFAAETDPDSLRLQLGAALPAHLAGTLRFDKLEDRDWEQSYRQHFKPLQCAPRLWVVPSWCEAPDPDAINIRLDPGLAFGTGGHATTYLCLAWLAAADLRDCSIIDYGCGSGILAIAACRLGASSARAVDIDPQALDACRANLEVNEIDRQRVQVSLPAAMLAQPADLLVANILAGPLLELAPEFARLVVSGGRILLSGILKTQLEEIQLAYRPYFELDPAETREDWVCLSGKRNTITADV